jgi:uncharacterized membrane protein
MNKITEQNNTVLQTLIDWLTFSGDYVVATFANTSLGAYLGFVEADVGGVFSIAISIVLTPIIIFLLIYPFKNFIDVILHCVKHKKRQDRIKCRTGFVVLIIFLIALIVKQYPIEPWVQNSTFALFAIFWVIWFGIGRWWIK